MPRNIIACEEVDELDMLERMYAEPSGDLISRQWLLDLYDIDTTGFKETAKVPLEVVIQNIKDAPSADRPQVNSAEWVAEKEKEFEELNRPKGECADKPQPYVPEASTERVVHCKDCVYSKQPEGEELFVCENRFGMSGWVREDDFCSSGSL